VRARWTVALVIVAVGVGAFFGGRASVSGTQPSVPPRPTAASFQPFSVSFVSTATGWTLGTEACSSGPCLTLLKTADHGRTWSLQPLPSSIVDAADNKVAGDIAATHSAYGGLNVRFANAQDGWIYGSLAIPATTAPGSVTFEPALWSTHDGGVDWKAQSLSWVGGPGAVFDLEAAAGTVHVLAPNRSSGVTVESSPVGTDSWHVSNTAHLGDPAGGGLQTGSIVLNGSEGWLVEGNDRGTTGSARLAGNGKWVDWTPPCASVGSSYTVPAAATSNDLVAGCTMGGFAFPLSKSAPPGATIGSIWLYFSDDAGTTFAAGPELKPPRTLYDYGVLAAPVPSTILMGRGVGSGQLIATFDVGAHWVVVYPAEPYFLGFTSTAQGVGLVEPPGGASRMIMTSDGGHQWSTVTF